MRESDSRDSHNNSIFQEQNSSIKKIHNSQSAISPLQSSIQDHLIAPIDISMNLGKIRSDPFQFITDWTTRDTLFKIIYILEGENQELIDKLELNQKLLQVVAEDKEKTSLGSAQGREASIQFIENKNRQNSAENKLLTLYREQEDRLRKCIQEQERSIKQLRLVKEQKQQRKSGIDKLLEQSRDKLVSLKERKARLIDEIERKKNNEKLADSGFIDKLLREYYETIQQELNDSSSVERINNNAKTALGEVGKTKNIDLFTAFLQEISDKQNK